MHVYSVSWQGMKRDCSLFGTKIKISVGVELWDISFYFHILLFALFFGLNFIHLLSPTIFFFVSHWFPQVM